SKIVNNWSIERDTSSINVKLLATEPTISLKSWISSYQWTKSTENIISIPNDSSNKYYIPARDLQFITQANLDKYENKKWTSFNQFKKSFDIWCLEMKSEPNWKTSKPPTAAKTVPI
ncbi:unnamed protein product, partial [Rotaria magnacalcarata]